MSAAPGHFAVTFFTDSGARSKDEKTLTLVGLATLIENTATRSALSDLADQAARDRLKKTLPWLKLARFGDKLSANRSLRHDANMLAISGIEGDYDLARMNFDEAFAILRRSGLSGIIYTSPSHTPEKPRWRVLCPLSQELPVAIRKNLMARLNGIYGGNFSSESFTNSQSYYYGHIKGMPPMRVEVCEGTSTVDTRDDLDTGAMSKKKVTAGSINHPTMIKIIGTNAARGVPKQETLAQVRAMMEREPEIENGPRWRELYEALPKHVEDIYAKEAAKHAGKPNWHERGRGGLPRACMLNAKLAIIALGVECSHDMFHNTILFGYRDDNARHELQSLIGEATDAGIMRLRNIIAARFDFDPETRHVKDAVHALALENCFDPVQDMLIAAEGAWDGIERLDAMAVNYFNADDTPLNRAFVRKTMIAAVRRVRCPGCKFDTILVMESKEGYNKSTAWRVLAGDENFSDERVLGAASREVQEQLGGIWIHENAELSGMRKGEVEHIKAFASRQVDIARPAFGHLVIKQKRHSIEVGTTNSDAYLQSQTGNRRFWPLPIRKPINIESLKHDRLQLWGEAARRESAGESIVLPEELWDAAGKEQEERRATDPWENVLAHIPNAVPIGQGNDGEDLSSSIQILHHEDGLEKVSTSALLTHVLRIPIGMQKRAESMRLAEIMKLMGWERSGEKMAIGGMRVRGYFRTADAGSHTPAQTGALGIRDLDTRGGYSIPD